MKKVCLIGLCLWVQLAGASTVDSLIQSLERQPAEAQMDQIMGWTDSLYQNRDSLLETFVQGATSYTGKQSAHTWQLFHRRYRGLMHLIRQRHDSARHWFKAGLAYAQSFLPEQSPHKLLEDIGKTFRFQSQYDSATAYFLQVESHLLGTADSLEMDWVYFNLGVCADELGAYEQSMGYFTQAQRYFSYQDNQDGIIDCYNSMGIVQQHIGNWELAADNFAAALEGLKESPSLWLKSNVINNLGISYYNIPDFERAKPYFEEAYTLKKKIGDRYGLPSSITNLAAIAWQEKEYDQAYQYDLEALDLHKKNQNRYGQAQVLNDVGAVLREKGQLTQAQDYAEQAIALAREIKARKIVAQGLINLSSISYAQGKYAKAYNLQREYIGLNDSLKGEASLKQVNELQIKFNTEKKEQALQLTEVENALLQEQVARRSTWLWLVGSLLLLAGVLALVFWQRKRMADRATEIERQKVEALEKQKQIDSMSAMIEGQESERSRIARDLHDGLGGLLSSVKLRLSNLASNPSQPEFYSQTDELIDEAAAEVRRIAHNMVPGVLLRFGLVSALETLCEQVRESGKVDLDFQALRVEKGPSETQEAMVYRIVQELIQNMLKHAQATEGLVQLAQHEGSLEITIEDDGKGFDAKKMVSSGLGMQSVGARIDFLGGTWSVNSAPGQGTSILIMVPWNTAKG
ncbi:MAG: sensor histidine kinase [Bacteroidota bacterium]